MQIQASTINSGVPYQKPFVSAQKNDDSQNTNNKSISATEVNARKAQNHQSNAMKTITKQIEKLQESIKKVEQDEKLSSKEKTDQIKAMQKEVQELQKQIIETQQREQEEKIKEQQEKHNEEEAKHLSPEENERKAQEAQKKALTDFAVASDRLKAAVPFYYKVKEYSTRASLGSGSKYGGNLSVEAVEGLSLKAAKYGKLMVKELRAADRLVKSAIRVSEEYNKHKKASPESEDKDENGVKVEKEDQENKEVKGIRAAKDKKNDTQSMFAAE